MRERGRDETTIASARTVRDPAGLDEDDVTLRIALLGEERGPQAAESPADDQQVAPRVRGQGRAHGRSTWLVKPEDGWVHAAKGVLGDASGSAGEKHDGPFEVGGCMKPEPTLRRPTNPFEIRCQTHTNRHTRTIRAYPYERRYASASISTSIASFTNCRPASIVAAGRISPNSSPWARPTSSMSDALARNNRVRTTSLRVMPA
ncbi:unannotated protein [freshwater metagenome]|uniref:Unannotated protein n=1 Tax=freshwater metagenome TaxID=449393 RepID=A0A6J6UYY5_9ZZZZ